MKKIVFLLAFVGFFFFGSFVLRAETFEEITEAQKQAFGWSDLEEAVPPETEEFYSESVSPDGLSGLLSPDRILSSVGKAFFNAFSGSQSFFYGLLAILSAEVLLRILAGVYPSSKMMETISTLLILSAALVLCGGVFSSVGTFSSCMERLSSFSESLVPVVAGLTAASGRPAFGTFASSFLFALTAFFTSLLSGFALPCTKVFLASGIGGGLCGDGGLQKFTSACRNFLIAGLTFLFCIFVGVFSLQSFLTVSADSLTKQSLKFAAGNFVPVAGGYIGETLETFYACAAGLRNTSGCFGLVVIFSLVVLPAADLGVKYLVLRVAECISGVFQNGALVSFFGIAKDAFAVLFSVVVGYGAMLMLMMVILMRSG